MNLRMTQAGTAKPLGLDTLVLAHVMWCVWQREQRVRERATFSRWLQSLRGW